MELFVDIVIGLLTGVLSGTYSGLIMLRYSVFLECKNRPLDLLKDFRHFYYERMAKEEHMESLIYRLEFLQVKIGIAKARLEQLGHTNASQKLHGVQMDVKAHAQLIESSSNNQAMIAEEVADIPNKLDEWIKAVTCLDYNIAPLLKVHSRQTPPPHLVQEARSIHEIH